MQYHAVHYSLQCSTLQCNDVQYDEVKCSTLHFRTVKHNAVQINSVQFSTELTFPPHHRDLKAAINQWHHTKKGYKFVLRGHKEVHLVKQKTRWHFIPLLFRFKKRYDSWCKTVIIKRGDLWVIFICSK